MSREAILKLALLGVVMILGLCIGNYMSKHVFNSKEDVSPYSVDTLYFQTVEDIVIKMPNGKVRQLVSDGVNTYIECEVHGGYTYVPFVFDTSQIKIRAVYDSTKTQ